MSDQKKYIISDKERKQIYRAKLRDQLGDAEYKNNKHCKRKNTEIK